MFTYGPGSGIVAMFLESPHPLTRLAERPLLFSSGAVLMLINSVVVVVGIGVLLYPILRSGDHRIALGYYATRIIEGTLLALGVVALLALVPIAELVGGDRAAIAAVSTFAVAVNDISY